MNEKDKESDPFAGMFDETSAVINTTAIVNSVKETLIVETVEAKIEKIEAKDIPIDLTEKDEYPILMGSEKFPDDYKTLYSRLIMQYRMLPHLNYDEMYKEIASLSVKSCPTPTLSVLNRELENVQSAKDRLCEIFIDVLKCYTFKKRAVDIIRDSWLKFAGGKAEGKNESIRKGESVYISSDFEQDLAQTESLLQACKHIIKNLDSLTENLSRRITIIQLQVKVMDVGRGNGPDFVFDKRANADVTLSEMADEVDVGEPKEKEEKDISDII